MKAGSIYSLLLTALMGAQLPAAFAAPLPGTPLAGVFGPQDIVEGGNLLPTQVEPGDIVMQENPLGGVNRGNWSDIGDSPTLSAASAAATTPRRLTQTKAGSFF
jgi:hypothetical protein